MKKKGINAVQCRRAGGGWQNRRRWPTEADQH
jgi:hypothetical protein